MAIKTVLITGASGFVGANLAHHLSKKDYRVHATIRDSANAWRLADLGGLVTHNVSLSDFDAVRQTVQAVRPDVIFHLAAANPYTATSPEHFVTNALATANLVDLAVAGASGSIVVAGSSSEYGAHEKPLSEDTLCMPTTAYGVSKLAGSLYCSAVGRTNGYPAVVLRIFSAYGPYEPRHRLFPTVLSGLLHGRPLNLGDPESVRDYVHVDDLTEAFEIAAARAEVLSGEIINLASGRSTSVRTIVRTAMDELKTSVNVQWNTAGNTRAWDRSVWIGTTGKASALLGWQPQIELADGIQNMASWLRGHTSLPEYQ